MGIRVNGDLAAGKPGGAVDGRSYLAACRELVLEEIRGFVPRGTRYQRELYDLVLDYPLRPAKGLRPSLCIAACRVFGGLLEAALPTAAVLELYHNAFLVHDDVEDESERRRGEVTLQRTYGVPIAVNVGDAMLALTLKPLLDNTALIGVGRALRVLAAVSEMATESAEGQALELHWIRRGQADVTPSQYIEMVAKKTAHYSFVAPLVCGGVIAGATDEQVAVLRGFGHALGVTFQIQDDLLNFEGDEDAYGKERYGDLWEGKYTLLLIEALARATEAEGVAAQRILAKPRPVSDTVGVAASGVQEPRPVKTRSDVDFLVDLIERRGGLQKAKAEAHLWATRAKAGFGQICDITADSEHRRFLEWLVDYTVKRAE